MTDKPLVNVHELAAMKGAGKAAQEIRKSVDPLWGLTGKGKRKVVVQADVCAQASGIVHVTIEVDDSMDRDDIASLVGNAVDLMDLDMDVVDKVEVLKVSSVRPQ